MGMFIKKVTGIETRLPAEYQEVEYLQSSGTQYIDTGIKNKSSLSITGNFIMNETSGNYIFGGTEEIPRGIVCWNSTSGFRSYFNDSTSPTISVFPIGSEVSISMTNGTTIVNGTTHTYTPVADFELSTNLILFAGGNHTYPSKIFMKSFTIQDGETLVRNMVPCYRKSDSVAGMYDLVNNQFYTNANTTGDDFVVGPNVSPYELVQVASAYKIGIIPEGTKTIESNGTHDVTEYASVNVNSKQHITMKNVPITITQNYYYQGGSNPTPIAYNGWNISQIIDISDTTYIAITDDAAGWTYNYTNIDKKRPISTGYTFNYNNKYYRVYNKNGLSAIGFSNNASAMSGLMFYKVTTFDMHETVITEITE